MNSRDSILLHYEGQVYAWIKSDISFRKLSNAFGLYEYTVQLIDRYTKNHVGIASLRLDREYDLIGEKWITPQPEYPYQQPINTNEFYYNPNYIGGISSSLPYQKIMEAQPHPQPLTQPNYVALQQPNFYPNEMQYFPDGSNLSVSPLNDQSNLATTFQKREQEEYSPPNPPEVKYLWGVEVNLNSVTAKNPVEMIFNQMENPKDFSGRFYGTITKHKQTNNNNIRINVIARATTTNEISNLIKWFQRKSKEGNWKMKKSSDIKLVAADPTQLSLLKRDE